MTFVFLHIDRTGGMAVREWLAAQFDYTAIRPVPHHHRSRLQPESYPLDTNADLHYQNRHYIHHPAHRLVMGHWDAGILQKVPGPVQVLTVLRDPAERAASLWRYICRERDMYGMLSDEARQLGREAFLLRHGELWVHAMSRQLSGARWSDAPLDYRVALKNVQGFDKVWVTQHLPMLMYGERVPRRINDTEAGAAPEPSFYDMVADLIAAGCGTVPDSQNEVRD